jgi:hypothetical protein
MIHNSFRATFVALLVVTGTASAAPKPDPWSKWEVNDPQSTTRIDHTVWGAFLQEYVVADHPSGVNRVKYGSVSPEDRKSLDGYVASLEAARVSALNPAEQKAYWINLYNGLTVKVILEHYPVESIRDIKSGLFKAGPWDKKLLQLEGEKVTLNDIEHRILRPIWEDNRVHYAVNCASIGCPNLQPEAYTVDNMEDLLDKAAREYVNHQRGARIEGAKLTLSSIYDWFQVDFGSSEREVIEHLGRYADEPLAAKLKGFDGKIRYEYDWSLNE